MLPEDVYQLGSRPLAIPRKALATFRESGVSGLKDATLDLGLEYIGLERVHAVCGLVTDRLARTREALQRLNPTEGVVDQSLGILPLSSVCTLGVSLLDRTEAIFDRWLTLTAGSAEGVEGGDSEGEENSPRVPRPIPGGMVLRTISWRISRTAMVRFTLLGIQENCAAAVRCLASSELLQVLARRLRPARLDKGSHGHALAARATRLAHQGCERLIGDAATMRLLDIVSRLLGRWLGSLVGTSGQGFRDEESALGFQILDAEGPSEAADGAQLQVQSPVAEPAAQATPEVVALELVSGTNSETPGERFTLVVKNSFIEVFEEPASPVAIRRTRSLDGIAGKQGTMEVFTLVVNCVGPAARGQPAPAPAEQESGSSSSASPAPTSRPHAAGRPPPEAAPAPAPVPVASGPVEAMVAGETEADTEKMTVLLKGIPSVYTTLSVLELLDAQGFAGKYTFVYVPVDFARGSGLGYAVVSMASHESALDLMHALEGFSQWASEDDNDTCAVSWNEPHQGLDALIERYRNSPVMHPSVAPAHRPAVFHGGRRAQFPPPTRTVRAPRIRHVRTAAEAS